MHSLADSFLTGEYAFRKKGTGIASGIEGLLIEPRCMTVPALPQCAGYATGIVGKWHLGLGVRPTDYNGHRFNGVLRGTKGTIWEGRACR